MKNVKPLLMFAAVCILIHACRKDYLEKRPLGQLDETALANKKGVEGLLIGAYSLLDGIGGNKSGHASAASNWIYGSICGSEAYKGSSESDQVEISAIEVFSPTATNENLDSKWGTVYDGVQRANDVLRLTAKASDIDADDQKRITAEARFLRAHYLFEAKKMWNNIPFIDESITYANRNYHVSNESDTWPAIENDLKYAVDNLPLTPYGGAVGRANKYTAMALLAKAYLFQNKFALAKPLLETIINSSNYELVRYADNFNPETKNSKESIFSVQMSVNDGAEGLNGNFGDVYNFPVGGPGGCCGFFQPSQYLVNHFKTDATTGLPDLDDFNTVDVTNDEKLESTDSFTPYSGTLDPRLDWTLGRRGIPYLDWGNHPGKDWIRDQNYGGPYSPKKNVYYQSQQGRLTDAAFWGNNTTTNNVNLIRYADVLLWAAEVETEIGDLNKARDYVNLVRARAADEAGWVKKTDGSPAANYKIGLYSASWNDQSLARKAIRYERMLELAMEGHRFFDLVRWGIADAEINSYLQKEKTLRSYLNGAVFTKNINDYFPIPQTQIDLSAGTDGVPAMKQNPGY
jgi:hypothetical protein